MRVQIVRRLESDLVTTSILVVLGWILVDLVGSGVLFDREIACERKSVSGGTEK